MFKLKGQNMNTATDISTIGYWNVKCNERFGEIIRIRQNLIFW